MSENFKIHLQGTSDTKQWIAAEVALKNLESGAEKFKESLSAPTGTDDLTARLRANIAAIEKFQSRATDAAGAIAEMGGAAETGAGTMIDWAGKAAAAGRAASALGVVTGLAYAQAKRLESSEFVSPDAKRGVALFTGGVDTLKQMSDTFFSEAIAGWGIVANVISGGTLAQDAMNAALAKSEAIYDRIMGRVDALSEALAQSQMTPAQKIAALGQQIGAASVQRSQAVKAYDKSILPEEAVAAKVAEATALERVLSLQGEVAALVKEEVAARAKSSKAETEEMDKKERMLLRLRDTATAMRLAIAQSQMTPETRLASLGQELGKTDSDLQRAKTSTIAPGTEQEILVLENKRLETIKEIAAIEKVIAADKESAYYAESNALAAKFSKQADNLATLKALAEEAAGNKDAAADIRLQRQAEHEASGLGITPPERFKQLKEEKVLRDRIRDNARKPDKAADGRDAGASPTDDLIRRAQESRKNKRGDRSSMGTPWTLGGRLFGKLDWLKSHRDGAPGTLGNPVADASPQILPSSNSGVASSPVKGPGSGSSSAVNFGENKAAAAAKEAASGMRSVVNAVTQRDAATAAELQKLRGEIAVLARKIADGVRIGGNNR